MSLTCSAGHQAEYEQSGKELSDYQSSIENSWVYEELKSVRNYHPSFKVTNSGSRESMMLVMLLLWC